MNIFLSDDELEEIKPLKKSEDNGLVIIPGKPNGENKQGRIPAEEERSDIIKELIANDAIELGARESAMIHGVSPATANRYSNGNSISDPEVKTRVIAAKHDIENLAVAKLMETLNLLEPSMIDKEKDKVTVINGLSQVIERINGKDNGPKNAVVVHLEMHAPPQRKESDYEVIEA